MYLLENGQKSEIKVCHNSLRIVQKAVMVCCKTHTFDDRKNHVVKLISYIIGKTDSEMVFRCMCLRNLFCPSISRIFLGASTTLITKPKHFVRCLVLSVAINPPGYFPIN